MAEFGPKVFHALGMYADKDRNNKFETGCITDVGLSEGNISSKELEEQLERVKNAFFKLIMFRARNTMLTLNKCKTDQLKEDGIPVTVTLYFSNKAVHIWQDKNQDDIQKILSTNFQVEGISALEEVWDMPDMEALYQGFTSLAMACGSNNNLDKKLSKKFSDGAETQEDDDIYSRLW